MMGQPDEGQVKSLLQACDLPVADITPSMLENFIAEGDESGLAGVVGLEIYDDSALLRSLAVAPECRKAGLGKQLVEQAEAHARDHGVKNLYLLTTTADKFFSKLGYSVLSRDQAPASIQGTTEFSTLCPSSSIFMARRISEN